MWRISDSGSQGKGEVRRHSVHFEDRRFDSWFLLDWRFTWSLQVQLQSWLRNGQRVPN